MHAEASGSSMIPTHHPSDAVLAAHAAGSLGAALSLVVTSHARLCAECRERLLEMEAVGGALLDSLPPEALSSDALDRALGRLDEPPPDASDPLPPAVLPLPWPVEEPRWRPLAPGIRQVDVIRRHRRHGGSARLLRIAPGVELPHHGHSGLELTLVISGWFHDEFGRFGPGDLAETDESVHHRPVAGGPEDCVCLLALDGPLRFTGWLGRLFQPWFGI